MQQRFFPTLFYVALFAMGLSFAQPGEAVEGEAPEESWTIEFTLAEARGSGQEASPFNADGARVWTLLRSPGDYDQAAEAVWVEDRRVYAVTVRGRTKDLPSASLQVATSKDAVDAADGKVYLLDDATRKWRAGQVPLQAGHCDSGSRTIDGLVVVVEGLRSLGSVKLQPKLPQNVELYVWRNSDRRPALSMRLSRPWTTSAAGRAGTHEVVHG